MRRPVSIWLVSFLAASLSSATLRAETPSGFLGIVSKPLVRELARSVGLRAGEGAHVVQVMPSSPAAAAGLREGDVIVSVDGRKVTGPGSLAQRIASAAPGLLLRIEVIRGHARVVVRAQLAVLRSLRAPSNQPKSLGLAIRS